LTAHLKLYIIQSFLSI